MLNKTTQIAKKISREAFSAADPASVEKLSVLLMIRNVNTFLEVIAAHCTVVLSIDKFRVKCDIVPSLTQSTRHVAAALNVLVKLCVYLNEKDAWTLVVAASPDASYVHCYLLQS